MAHDSDVGRVVVGNALDWPTFPIGAAATACGLVWTAGLVSCDPETGEIVEGDIKVQTARALDNLDLVLAAAGSDRGHIVLMQAFLGNIRRDFADFNAVYAPFFEGTNAPPRFAIESKLALDPLLVELQAVAKLNTANG